MSGGRSGSAGAKETPSRRRAVTERFLDLFSEVEKGLKSRLGRLRGDRSSFQQLLHEHLARNPLWRDDADELHLHAEIRNLLSHQRGIDRGYPVRVHQRTVQRLEAILQRLNHPTPIGKNFCKQVETVHADDPLDQVLARASQFSISQFPVVDRHDGRFRGLITENSVVRWLGRQSIEGSAAVDMRSIQVSQVIKEEEPDRKQAIFRFRKPQDPEDEVLGMFVLHPMLEVVLLIDDGSNKTPVKGIATAWDAARYSSRGVDAHRGATQGQEQS
jgi:CBS domain-containing protein